jgi:transcriptional regulator with XRE-family HTH domain
MARKIDMSATYLSKIERGEYPPPAEEKVRGIAKLLDCDADELLALAGRVPSDLRDIIKEHALEWGPLLRKFEAIERTPASVGLRPGGYLSGVPLPDRSAEYDCTAEFQVDPTALLPTASRTTAPGTTGLVSDLTQIIREYPEQLAALLRAVKGSPPDKWADIWREKCLPQKEE